MYVGGGATLDRKAFTLIELLAVIVILAIIALIATPIILNIISDTKDSANKRSVELYGKAIENAVADYMLLSNGVAPTWEDISENDNIKKYYSGNTVECTTTKINEDGTVYLDGCKVGNKTVDYKYGKDIGSSSPVTTYYSDGTPIYFNVTTGEKCSESESLDTGSSGCMTFYAFGDVEGETTLNLLLGHNTSNRIPWISSDDYQAAGGTNGVFDEPLNGAANDIGPLTLLNQLQNDTKDWKGTVTPTNYTSTTKGYTINYSGYKARLMTAQELSKVLGGNWQETDDTGISTDPLSPTLLPMFEKDSFWLANSYVDNMISAWYTYIYESGGVGSFCFGFDFTTNITETPYDNGVRPVITVSKALLS